LRSRTLNRTLFIVIIIFLFIPIFQKTYSVFDELKVKGVYKLNERTNLSLTTWYSGEYQEDFGKYYTDHIGFRGFFIKLLNQVNFSLFNKSSAFSIVLGKEGYTYGQGYIENTLTGKDFIGESRVDSILNKVKEIQYLLKKKLNIDLITVYAPSKEFVIPEYIPERYLNDKIGLSNKEYFIKKSKEIGLNYLDLNKFMVDLKNTSPYPVYYKQGEHWSYYSMILAGKHLVNYIEKLRKIDMPDINIVGIENSDTARFFDNDQGDAMNLLFDIKQEGIVYPKLQINNKNKIQPNVLAIADCYYLHIFRSPVADSCFNNGGDFWFYNRQKSSKKYGDEQDISVVNKHEVIIKQDIIIHMLTNHNLKDFGFGFFDEIESLIDESKHQEQLAKKQIDNFAYEEDVKATIARVKANSEWFEQVKTEAKKRNLTIEKMLDQTAKHVIKNRKK